jgi:1,4-dihydroxy-2-naphthoate octaprenyltransferase
MSVRDWFREAVEPSLLMSFLLVTLGTAAAARNGFFNLGYYFLALIGVTLTQNAVNVLNDYHDYKTGVDAKTIKMPFSGGSKYLVSGTIRPESAFSFAVVSLLLAAPIGIYFTLQRWLPLLAIVAFAAISVYFYTTVFARTYPRRILGGPQPGTLSDHRRLLYPDWNADSGSRRRRNCAGDYDRKRPVPERDSRR